MKETIEALVGALRDELEQYGGMLALLDQQQELAAQRRAADLLENVAAINAQTSVLQVARRERERRQCEVALTFQLPADAALRDLVRVVPRDYRPLIEALVDENNQCLQRVKRLAGQNHLLLTRSVELTQRLLGGLLAVNQTKLYGEHGEPTVAVTQGRALCDAQG